MDRIIAHRRALHQIPELEAQLPGTMAYLAQALEGLNCRVFSPMESALCAFFDFGREETIAFRADCDALPIQETTGADYASCREGRMHACGHDGHMAILLELARRVSRKKTLPNNILLVFQPAEESPGGAEPLCATGVLEKNKVKALFGLHLWPGLEKGIVHSRPGELMARASEVNVDIYGKSAHIAKAAEGIDAVAAGVEFYRRAMEREASLPDTTFRLLKFGRFHSGTARNALSAHTRLEGSLRAFRDETFDYLKDGLLAIAADLETEFGCRTEITFSSGYPAVLNPGDLAARVMEIAPYRVLSEPSMTAEDFSFYQKRCPAMFFFLGLGDTPALHAANFDFDDSILVKGADFFEKLAESAL